MKQLGLLSKTIQKSSFLIQVCSSMLRNSGNKTDGNVYHYLEKEIERYICLEKSNIDSSRHSTKVIRKFC
ncbi:hypothetical protein Gasu2_28770 [Galdieria sulphuraria]|uniref:Uncharacterized protein n=1 Tax=Galdieria sulphuraria TaxID=130081 RepID=M2XF42_GALSU|nr:uncharacterized protein Gasu_39940 [Galdieria sulphuraria]EME28622.1 hypothetical protein Gasu_39940 [Galdieria sulphuraria]GJD08583.1 hypothetical protein Gasu2_28770 [Galdieria sulphuraria]|eukprot:XP_005705142.1 hypothetical protein Gasu_39940 [Galdieria sulphuraria]